MKAKITLLFFISFFSLVVRSQTAYFKIANNGTLQKIEKVSSGGYITIGTDSVYKVQVIRWDNNFNAIWKHKFTDPNVVGSWFAIVEGNDGSFYLRLMSSAHTGSVFIVKFSSSGTILWEKEYYVAGGNLFSYSLSKASGTDNGFIFGGGQCSLSNYLIKCDQDGNIQWQKQYYYPLASGVITTWSIIPEGNNYVVSSGYNANSLLTFRIDSAGGILTYKAYTYSTMQIIPTRLVKLNNTNGYAILGNYNSTNNNKTEFVAILDNSFSMLSFNELTVTYDQFVLLDIAAINNGQNLILDGSIYDNSDFFIATINLSATGTMVWKHLSQGNTTTPITNVEFHGVTSLGNSTVHVGYGYNEGSIVSIIDSAGNGLCNMLPFAVTNVLRTLTLQSSTLIPLTSNAVSAAVNYVSNTNVSSTKYFYCGGLPSAIDEQDNNAMTIEVYPSPASESFFVQRDNASLPATLQLLDGFGRKVHEKVIPAGEKNIIIDIRNVSSGIYFVCLSSDKETVARKIVVQR